MNHSCCSQNALRKYVQQYSTYRYYVLLLSFLFNGLFLNTLITKEVQSQTVQAQSPQPHPMLCNANGHYTVLVFLAESCPICQQYAPVLRELYQRYTPQKFDFLGIFPDTETLPEEIEKFTREYKLPFPTRLDSAQQLVSLVKATITPEVVVLSPQGTVLYQGRIDNMFVGWGKKRTLITEHDLADALEALANKKPVARTKAAAVGCFIEVVKTPIVQTPVGKTPDASQR